MSEEEIDRFNSLIDKKVDISEKLDILLERFYHQAVSEFDRLDMIHSFMDNFDKRRYFQSSWCNNREMKFIYAFVPIIVRRIEDMLELKQPKKADYEEPLPTFSSTISYTVYYTLEAVQFEQNCTSTCWSRSKMSKRNWLKSIGK